MDASYEELYIQRKEMARKLEEMQRDMVTDYPYTISSASQFRVLRMLQNNGVWKGDYVYISPDLSPKEQKSLFKFSKKYAKKFKVRYPDTPASSAANPNLNPNPDSSSGPVSSGTVEKGESIDVGNCPLKGVSGGAMEKGESEYAIIEEESDCRIKEKFLTDDAGNSTLKGLEQGGAVEKGNSEGTIKDVGNGVFKGLEQGLNLGEVGHEDSEDTCGKFLKERNSQPSPSLSVSVSLSPSQSVGTGLGEIKGGSSILSFDEACQQIVEELKDCFKEIQDMQKQMSMTLAAPIAEEGQKLEETISQCVEKATRVNGDMLLARIQENMAKHEHMTQDQFQLMIGWINNLVNKDFERLLKKELDGVGTNITTAVCTAIKKNISPSIIDYVQRGVSDKVADQVEKLITSKIEATLATQIQAQFKSSDKQIFQDGLKLCFETIVIPALERTCKAMFEQFDVFQKKIVGCAQAAEHQVDKTHYQLALSLMGVLDYASFLCQALSRELADGHGKLLALALHESVVDKPPFDPTRELSRLIAEQKYEEAFASALQRSDVSIVSWLCSQVYKVLLIVTSMSASLPTLSPVHEMDKISQLPDEILLEVLSKLTLKDAVRMSILAKRSRYLWTWLTDLDFHPGNLSRNNCHCGVTDEIGTEEYRNWVTQVVDAHRGSCISKFGVFLQYWIDSIVDPSQIEKWVRFAFSKKVEELHLHMIISLKHYPDPSRFSLGIDILKHPRDNGSFKLKSLRLSRVNITAETLEFILLQCHLLERLYVENSYTLHSLHILSYKLKHLTVIDCCLKEFEIDALNLISFEFDDFLMNMVVFKNVPKFVELSLRGSIFMYSCLSLKRFSGVLKQLMKLSFSPTMELYEFDHPEGLNVVFPIVKQLTLSVACSNINLAFIFIKLFINACPVLHELKLRLQIEMPSAHSRLQEEAKLLREIELEDEGNDVMSIDQNPYTESQERHLVNNVGCKKYENNTLHPNLKVLEMVGVHGCDADVECALFIITCANSFETLIWDPGHHMEIGNNWECEDVEKTNTVRRRARKLAKLLPPNVHVAVRDKSGLIRVS